MKALQFSQPNGPAQLVDLPDNSPSGFDLLVSINAVAVNPVDIKVQSGITDKPKTLGWDACATVVALGDKVRGFKVGDRVFYAGDVSRPGCFASQQLVDSRIVGHAPKSLDDLETASLPLVSLTAWELLFNRLRISLQKDHGKSLLIIGAAGGVGSMLIQLARQIAGLKVIASVGSDDSAEWCRSLGAHDTVSHRDDLLANYQQTSLPAPDYIICLGDSDLYLPIMAELIKPQGLIGLVVSFNKPVDLNLLKNKSAGLVWEFMFSRPMLQTDDMQQQHRILQRIAELIQSGCIRHTLTQRFDTLTVDNLQAAHALIETGHNRGKIALGPIPGSDNA
ncbi:MAG TPA: zinc-binding alcohol dehydrogenase family protein [Methylophaga sp.]|nr:zinc-binding alcohol dehydrogenase family protein [Methylophaga sp.]